MTPGTKDREQDRRRRLELEIHRVFDAPRPLVFASWTEAERLGAWFAPAGFDVVDAAVDPRPGGRFRVAYRSPEGELYVERGEFIEVVAPERLRFSLINEGQHGEVNFSTEVQVAFHERDGKTTVAFRQTGFATRKLMDSVGEGWGTCLEKLDRTLAAEREIRALFEDWFRASERKDLDASMAPIARDVVSYEHDTPLLYRGADAVRAVCKAGFDQTPEEFRWEVPDLHVLIRGDVAITWGLNHMHGTDLEMWSRGTRIFRTIDGRWQMIHQHVSFPVDPTSGAAKMDLRP